MLVGVKLTRNNVSRRLERLEAQAAAASARNSLSIVIRLVGPGKIVTGILRWKEGEEGWTHLEPGQEGVSPER